MNIKAVLFFLLLASPLFAKDLYVSTTGSDSVTYANNDISHPWLTIHQACYNAQAGDTVYFHAGTYPISSVIDLATNGHDGAPGAWITFKPFGDGEVIYKSTGAGSHGYYGQLLDIGHDYLRFENITIEADPLYDCRTVLIGYTEGAQHVTFSGCIVKSFGQCDNAAGFYVGTSGDSSCVTKYITIQNCQIYRDSLPVDAGCTPGSTCRCSGIILFNVYAAVLDNNEIYHVSHGIYFKHPCNELGQGCNSASYVRNNYIHDLDVDNNSSSSGIQNNSGGVTISNNLIVAGSTGTLKGGIVFGENHGGSACFGESMVVDHNTIALPSWGPMTKISTTYGGHYGTFTNNIFACARTVTLDQYTSTGAENSQITETDYNLYSLINGNIVTHYGNNYSLSGWRTHMASDNCGGNRDAHSITGTPTFTGGANPSTIAGFKLTAASAGYHACADGSDMGADVSLVGPNADGSSPAPAPPTLSNVTISGGSFR